MHTLAHARATLIGLGVLCTLACVMPGASLACGGGGGEPQASPPASSRGPRKYAADVPSPDEEARRAAEAAEAAKRAAAASPIAPAAKPAAEAPAAAKPAAEEKPARDLGAELATAVGNLAACVQPRTAGSGTAAGTTLAIGLEAVVTENGIVTRSSVRASALEAPELDCVRRRLAAVRLRAPVEEAPRTVTTSITLTLQAAAPAAPPPAPPVTPTGTGYP